VSATRLLVLGVVRMYGKAHGYQVRRELLGWSADKWAHVAPGSIYHALKKMAGERLLEEVETDTEAKGPGRIAYRLTADGEHEFHHLLTSMLADMGDAQNVGALQAAITFMPTLPRAKAVSLLRHRITQLDGQRANATDLLENGVSWGHPDHVTALYRLWVASVGAELDWAKDLVRRLENGEYVMAGDDGTAFGTAPSNQT
jgi:DNA-binding PadR family transcriptional regulator